MTEMNHDHDNKTKANEVFEVSRPSASYGLVWLCVQSGGKISSYYSHS